MMTFIFCSSDKRKLRVDVVELVIKMTRLSQIKSFWKESERETEGREREREVGRAASPTADCPSVGKCDLAADRRGGSLRPAEKNQAGQRRTHQGQNLSWGADLDQS